MTLAELYKFVKEKLEKAGADSPAFEAIWLINAVFPFDRLSLIADADMCVAPELSEGVLSLVKRREAGEPIQYITGEWEFFGRRYFVGKGVLIPRDDTEVVLTCTFPYLDELKNKDNFRILDLCSGSGIIAISLKLRYPEAQVTAVELSDEALPYLEKNCREHNADIRIIHDDIFNCVDTFLDGEFDLIISNPPYITDEDMEALQKEVQFEPAMALAGGADGLDFYRRIIPLYTRKLKKGGMLAFEYDGEQSDIIASIMIRYGFENITVFDDIGGVHRAINGTLHNE
ncbi:MAG: peptide chain release factor N(5)-glutamine methyltransferase [Ruminococcus sp.]|nr:peptide chain release factor N(5)-glutamine methyltransferase [Ruminococcus sp.]